MSPSSANPTLLAAATAEEISCDGERTLWRVRGGEAGHSGLVLVPSEGRASARMLARLRHEYALRGKLQPEWALRPSALVERGGSAEMLLEDSGGTPLDRILADHARDSHDIGMDILRALSLAVAMAESLARLHGAGLVHRDIKPANIVVSEEDLGVRFTGFGLASELPRHQIAPAPLETIDGTLVYMSPEQTGRMNRSVDWRSDLYSLGIVLFEMLAGHPPFASDDPVELVHSHVARRPPLLSLLRPDVPQPVADIVMKLLAKPAEERYQTARGLTSDLRRCQDSWQRSRSVRPFRLGTDDQPDRLVVSEQLYGREAEVQRLQDAVVAVTREGKLGIALVSGYSGIGKSALVGELHRVLIEPRALFASGKFDQYHRHVPYTTWAQAMQGCVRQILGMADAQVAQWRDDILAALGANGRLMTELIPDLALLIGEQPPVTALPPNEAQIRFFTTFRRFLGVWATAQHPLVLFLDDVQWIDSGSLKLMEYLAIHPESRHLLLICAFRDNEVGPAHPLSLAVDTIRVHTQVTEISLTPLSLDHLTRMVSDTLSCAIEAALPLAAIISAKTEGNPFFAIQFMQGLVDERLLLLGAEGWRWDMAQIAGKAFTDNVVDLMVAKLRRLPPQTQEALRVLAYLGNQVPIRVFELIHPAGEGGPDSLLHDALRASYVARAGDVIRFTHDRIQEAAYMLLPADRRPAEHLRIARRLLAGVPAPQPVDEVFNIVNHFNLAVDLLDTPEERQQVSAMNAHAGARAKASAAYASARAFYLQALELLPPKAWEDDQETAFDLLAERTTCELLLGHFQQVDELVPWLIDRARNVPQSARAHRLLILRNQVSGRYGDGVDAALAALRLFHLDCPSDPAEVDAATQRLREDVGIGLAGRAVADLVDAPAMDDPAALAMLGVLADAMPCAFLARPDLYAWLALNGLNLTLRLGNTADSCAIYMGHAIVLVSKYDEVDAALAYTDLALKLQEKLGRPDLKGRILVRAGVFINSRRNPLVSSIAMLREGFVDCQAAGDYSYAVYGALEIAWLTFEGGSPVGDITDVALTFSAFAQQSRNNGLLLTLRTMAEFAAYLTGEQDFPTFRRHCVDVQDALGEARFGTGIAYVHLMAQWAALRHGDLGLAREHGALAAQSLKSITGWVAEATFHFLAVLTMAAGGDMDRTALAAHLNLLAKRAGECPENDAGRHALALAEIARLDGDALRAEHHYEEAIRQARNGGAVHLEALAMELAAAFYRQRAMTIAADAYLTQAHEAYGRWGARGESGRLELAHPQFTSRSGRPSAGTGMALAAQSLDLISVVKASQAVSGEIALDRLVETLLRIAVENAGAGRGVLLVDLSGSLTVVADARMEESGLSVASMREAPESWPLPTKIINYVSRSAKRVLVDDAAVSGDFTADPYFVAHSVRSVMCLPLVKQSRPIGLLYLEHREASHAFTAGRVAVLELLASQAAISLENSLLYQDLEHHRDDLERTVEERTAELIAKTNQLDQILTEQEIILENASLGVAVVEPLNDGRRVIRRANRALERQLGYAPGEMLGMDTRAIWRDAKEFAEIGARYKEMGQGQTYVGEHVIVSHDGGERYCRLVGATIDTTDFSKGTVWLIEDITDRHNAEIALKDAKKTAENLAAAFRRKSEQVAILLDNSGQGFLSCGADLVVNPEYSQACETMLGGSPAGKDIATLLFPEDEAGSSLLRTGVPMTLAEGNEFKRSLLLSLLPAEIKRGGRVLRAEYTVVGRSLLMMVLTDITEERRLQEKVEQDQQLLQRVVLALTESHDFFDAVTSFRRLLADDIPAMLESKAEPQILLEAIYREIHTVKGTLSQFAFHHTPAALHLLEDLLGELRAKGNALTSSEIRSCLATMPLGPFLDYDLGELRELLGNGFLEKGECVSLPVALAARLEALARSLLAGEAVDLDSAPIRALLADIAQLRKVPLRDSLAGLGWSVAQIAGRLGKEVAPLAIRGDAGLLLDPDVFGSFLRSLTHVFRNAVAHGIEDPDTRLQAGKDEAGHITCTVRLLGDGFELTIADDGQGIDLEAVRKRAVEIGALSPAEAAALSDAQVEDLVFLANLSTEGEPNQISGRGIGLAAARAKAEELGGGAIVRSRPGEGAAFVFTLPLHQS